MIKLSESNLLFNLYFGVKTFNWIVKIIAQLHKTSIFFVDIKTKTHIKMPVNFPSSIWKLLEFVLVINLTSSAVLSYEKFDKRKCSLFVPMDEKLIRYSQYNSETKNQDTYFRQSYDLVIASNVNLCLRGKDIEHLNIYYICNVKL